LKTSNLLDKQLAHDILEVALSTGGDFAEIFVENTKKSNIVLVSGKTDTLQSGIDYGIGIRIFKGFGAVYVYTNVMERENLLKVAKEAAAAVRGTNNGAIKVLDFTEKTFAEKHPAKILPGTKSKKEIVDVLRNISDISLKYDPLVTQTRGAYMDVDQEVLIANSEGLWATDKRVLSRVFATAVASKGNEKQTGSRDIAGKFGQEILEILDPKYLAEESARIAVTMVNADMCPSGRMPVVIDNGFGGVILHEALGHSLEATGVAKGASEFCGKLNEVVADKKVTVIDDATIENAWGSFNIDDEGSMGRKNVLIENGVLKSYLVDRLNGLQMGMESTGSSRRESYKFAPTSRMSNTYFACGTDTQDDIISSIEYGLYAKKMGGGSVQPATGEFNFAVLEGYIIEKGKIARPVRGASLIGKGSKVLADIDMVSDNLEMDAGVCGSLSGSVPTNCGQPMIRVKEITVGGRD